MKSLQGQLLIASSLLVDPNFSRSVLLMIQHGEEGALGVILNRPLKITIQTAWEQISEGPCHADGFLHQGGPCEGPLMVLHTRKALSQVEVLPGLYFSTEKDAVEQLVSTSEGALKFFVGYAGWGPGQLEGEMEEGGWLATPITSGEIFSSDDENWNRIRTIAARSAAFPWLDPATFPSDPSAN